MRLAPVIDLTFYYARRYTEVHESCSCYPGTPDNSWGSFRDPNCAVVHAWIIGIAPGFYPYSPFSE